MSQAGNPRDAIVSIWYQAISEGGTFKGSGAFVSPRLVLTASHLVEHKQPNEIRLSLVHGQHAVLAEKVYLHEKYDIAVLELARDFDDQKVVQLDCWNSSLEGTCVDLYGINPDTKSRDECLKYTIGTWKSESNEYLFDHQQRKGFSGGIAVLNGYAIGVISMRHTSEQQGTIVPLFSVRDWLDEKFPGLTQGRHFPVSPLDNQFQLHPTQVELARRVRQEISRLLKKQKLRFLHESLSRRAAERWPDEDPPDPVDLLVSESKAFFIDSSIDDLHQATSDCLERLMDQDSNSISDVASGATAVLGWLVLLAVNKHWEPEQTRLRERLLNAEYIAIPIETEAGTEVIFSRVRLHPAKLKLAEDGVKILSPYQLAWPELELGIGQRDRLTETKKLIWKEVMKSNASTFGEREEKRLRETLAVRYRRGESHYIIIPIEGDGSGGIDNALLAQLRRDFPHLVPFLIGAESGDQVFVIGEYALEALIRDFLLMLEQHL